MSSPPEPISALPDPVPAAAPERTIPRVLLWRLAWITPPVLALPWLAVARSLPVGPFFASLTGMLFVLLALVTTTTDLRWQRIYNWATYTAVGWMWILQGLALALGDWRVPDPAFTGWAGAEAADGVAARTLLGV